MIAYASRTGTRRNIAALRAAGWRCLVSASGVHRHEGMPYAIDNGAWSAFAQKRPWDEAAFLRLLDSHGARADFIVVPDVVADRERSLELARTWLPRLRSRFAPDGPRLLLAVQDGMLVDEVAAVRQWGQLAARLGRWYHVARVNSARRIRAAADSAATSFDGTSVTMYAETLPLLDRARHEPTLEHGVARTCPPRDHVADAELVARELPSYRDDEEVTLEAGALRALLATWSRATVDAPAAGSTVASVPSSAPDAR